MAQTPEAKVKAKIKAYLKTIPHCWWFMPIGGAYSTHGIPDIIGHVNGQFFAIEVKAPGRHAMTTALQKLEISKIILNGGIALVASDVQHVIDAFVRMGWDRKSVDTQP
jgi:hypothetical protein